MKPEKKRMNRITFFLPVLLVLIYSFCKTGPESQEIQNLRAFAKLYGYVRYFHPSDEASRIDWDRFTIYGVEKAKNAKNPRELKSILEELFLPVAPTIQIYHADEDAEAFDGNTPDDTSGLMVVAWQHKGIGFGVMNSAYLSIRVNRENILKPSNPGIVTQGIDAVPLRGKKIRLTASVKAELDEGGGNHGHLWLRVDRENKQTGFFDNMSDRPILSGDWNEYEIQGSVAGDAVMVYFGSIMMGSGKLWLDDFNLSVLSDDNQWVPVDLKNAGFEWDEEAQRPKDWGGMSQGYRYTVQIKNSGVGGKCLLIQSMGQKIPGPIFDKYPEIGDVVKKELAANLFCQIPLALYTGEKGTLGENPDYSFDKLVASMAEKNLWGSDADNEFVRLAGVTIAWNVFQHFYPYFDVVDVDWDRELTIGLSSALEDETEMDFLDTLRRLIAKLQDGHGNVYHRMWMQQAGLPFKVDWIENQVVVTVSRDPSRFQRGDIIREIDGIAAEKALKNAGEFISGSPQWKRYVSLNRFGYGEPGTTARLKLKRGDRVMEVEIERNFREYLTEFTRPPIEKIENEIYYVDLSKASWEEIHGKLDDLAGAKGIVFDLRGYPNSNHQIISHLLEKDDTSNAWMQIPLILYPDQEDIVSYQKMGWGLVAKKPHISGKAVFIVYGGCISYAESFMSFIEHYKLAEIVGQPTAGTNGNINPFELPGGYRVIWTGMKVVKHDGSQHHLIGIQPTVPAERTIRGVIEGRDEFLEKALEVIKR